MSDTIKTGLKQRITEAALDGLPISANFANEICDLIDANTNSTVKMSNEYHTRLIEIENELFGYGRKGRLNSVSADPEQVKPEVEPIQAEAANDEEQPTEQAACCANIVHALDIDLMNNWQRQINSFMGLPTVFIIKRK